MLFRKKSKLLFIYMKKHTKLTFKKYKYKKRKRQKMIKERNEQKKGRTYLTGT